MLKCSVDFTLYFSVLELVKKKKGKGKRKETMCFFIRVWRESILTNVAPYIYIYIVSAANRYCNATVSSRADKTATISIREVSRWIIRRERGAMERHTCSVSWTSRLVGDMHEIEPALLFE